jgi:hypothetical protein
MFFQIGKALYTIFSASPIFSHITNNMGSSGGKTFFAQIQGGGPLKLKKNDQRPNNRARPVCYQQYRPTLIFAGKYL